MEIWKEIQDSNGDYAHGLKKPMRGVLQTRALLSENDVRVIRKIYKPHSKLFGARALAKKYGVKQLTIERCVAKRSYCNVI